MVATSYCTGAASSGQVSMSHRDLRGSLAENEVDFGRVVGRNRDMFTRGYRGRKHGALNPLLGDYVVERAFADHFTTFMPGDDFVLPRGDLGELEVTLFVGHHVIGVG